MGASRLLKKAKNRLLARAARNQPVRLAAAVLLLVVVLREASAAGGELRAGRAAVRLDAATAEIYTKALVLASGDQRVVISISDLPYVDANLAGAARRAIGGAQPTWTVLLGATGARGAAAMGDPAAVAARIGEAVRTAGNALQPAVLLAGGGSDSSVAFYNRFLLKDGTVRANPGKLNPEIVQPAGEADPELALLRVENAQAHPLALLGSYALRPAIAAKFPGDYPAAMAALFARLHGPELVMLWSAVSGANVSHVDVKSKAPQSGAAEARRVGTVLAGEALKAEARARPVSFARMIAVREAARLSPLGPGHACPAEGEVQAVGFGDQLAIVALPGELWSELGTAIRRASPFATTILIGPANGWVGVLPTRRGYSDGALEADVHCAAGAGEAVAEAAARALAELRRRAALP